MNKLRKWLINKKKQKRWSFRQMANVIGVSQAHVNDVTKGKVNITWGFCAKIAEANIGLSHAEAFQLAGLLPEAGEKDEGTRPSNERVELAEAVGGRGDDQAEDGRGEGRETSPPTVAGNVAEELRGVRVQGV